MRNLYIRLGVDPCATEQEIESAIMRCTNSTVKTNATEVLLNPSRRRNYDRVHQTLCDIGVLRAHLGLNYGSNWGGPESDDFNTYPTHGLSLRDELTEKIRSLNKVNKVEERVDSTKEFLGDIGRAVLLFGGIVGFVGFVGFVSTLDTNSSSSRSSRSSYSTPPQPTFNEPALQLPSSGTIRRFTSKVGVAPLEIKTSSGSNYLVKLEDVSTERDILAVFIRGGSTIEIEIPLGTYRLKYAAGKTWYGYEHYFGPSTGYSKADTNFRFYNDSGRVSGYIVTLYQVRDGNLRTSSLSPGEF